MKLVVGVFIIYNNQVLLIRHKRKDKWLPAGGHVEKNEKLSAAAHREILEELNIKIELLSYNPKVHELSDMNTQDIPFSIFQTDDTIVFEYVALAKNIDTIKIQEEELDEYALFSKEEILASDKLIQGIKNKALFALDKYSDLQ